ncbi:hypothetical protein Rmet_6524 [Cupriavidus metallidurans CH34]|uniref:Uncharacterized protein n=1 Tax=Cupriavidus metallidurans (strain ATCC 43123 / DSM 2839 / NBRC 102507 / CH34) TaxID=266264 RepID=D3DXW1_CUPMC|nr:hypothetical protein Rmet_6524 [Cupriavidus metallidurans CH34]
MVHLTFWEAPARSWVDLSGAGAKKLGRTELAPIRDFTGFSRTSVRELNSGDAGRGAPK